MNRMSLKLVNYLQRRNFSLCAVSLSRFKDKNSYVVVTEDGQTIVCWHPEKPPEYEFSKPLPNFQPEINEGDSVLKVQYRRDQKYFFKPKGPSNRELAKLTNTAEHIWNEWPVTDKYKIRNPPVDREGI